MHAIVHLIRHEKSVHKAPGVYERLACFMCDPDLTIEGRENCRIFAKNFSSDTNYITHIWCSPMKRTINTALLSFKDVIARGVKVQAMDLLQNRDASANGIGMDKEDLQKHFGEQVDFDKVEKGWNEKFVGKWAPGNQDWKMPALKMALKDLRSTTNVAEVVIVSHGSLLDDLTHLRGDYRRSWRGEVRSYLINDLGEPCQLLNRNALKQYRSHATDDQTIPKADQDLPNTNDPDQSRLAVALNPSASKDSGEALVEINLVNEAIPRTIPTTVKILETAKQPENNPTTSAQPLQQDTTAITLKRVCPQEFKAEPIHTSKKISRAVEGTNKLMGIWSMSDHDIARKVMKNEWMWIKEQVSVQLTMNKAKLENTHSSDGNEIKESESEIVVAV
ncbi:06d4e72c-c8eb-42f7-add8-6232fd7e2480 [Sclerotinia trifoliorum]|uniref:06d4e72c-c8eb-42f7-add8-6232fd7e2480 n=1 Tax=Sclerotinia trifoliorum TaxID=28548 RepID=A0A8H2ZPL8_9HELO|nr:06d4e72c-c8eb-42f7-add8-6232fd7e2480 [Sclerotinia trifoliorum]